MCIEAVPEWRHVLRQGLRLRVRVLALVQRRARTADAVGRALVERATTHGGKSAHAVREQEEEGSAHHDGGRRRKEGKEVALALLACRAQHLPLDERRLHRVPEYVLDYSGALHLYPARSTWVQDCRVPVQRCDSAVSGQNSDGWAGARAAG